jgi:hypothetical protein
MEPRTPGRRHARPHRGPRAGALSVKARHRAAAHKPSGFGRPRRTCSRSPASTVNEAPRLACTAAWVRRLRQAAAPGHEPAELLPGGATEPLAEVRAARSEDLGAGGVAGLEDLSQAGLVDPGSLRFAGGHRSASGSSLRAPGTDDHAHRENHHARLIPACAGNGRRRAGAPRPRAAHPRVRGERCSVRPERSKRPGSSPRARGTGARGPRATSP